MGNRSGADGPASGRSARAEAAAEWAVTHRVDAGRWSIRYRSAGRGPALVLVHGLGMSADYWHPVVPSLAAAGWRVLAPDLPGYGRTEGPGFGLGVRRQAGELLRWIDGMGLREAVYVGHSLSCQTVIELAAGRPERVRGLILIAPTGDGHGFRRLRQAIGLARDAPRERLLLVATAAAAYLRAGPWRFLQTWRRGTRHQVRPKLGRVYAPTLIVLGDADPVVRPEFAAWLEARLRSARRVTIERGTHAVFSSEPERFTDSVLEFLDELRIRAGGRVSDEGGVR